MDTATELAKDLGVKLEIVPITTAARVPTLQAQRADLVISDLSITRSAPRSSTSRFRTRPSPSWSAAPKDMKIAGYADLNGKRIGLTRATTNDTLTTREAKGAEIMRYEDDATLITSVVTGQVDIFSSTPSNMGEINKRAAGKNFEMKFSQTRLGPGHHDEQGRAQAQGMDQRLGVDQREERQAQRDLQEVPRPRPAGQHRQAAERTATMRCQHKLDRLLLTGAAGGLGKVLRERLRPYADVLRLSDIAAHGAGRRRRTKKSCPATCPTRRRSMRCVAGCDAIVHLGGVSVERPFEEILEANIKGVFHIYEAARRHGVKRVVFASSNHVIGFYKQGEHIDADAARRPDGYYGLSKSFGEDVAQFYFDR